MDQAAAIDISRNYLRLLLQNNFEVEKVFLFGSYSKGNQHPDSDIDLAIILKDLQDPFQTQVEMLKLTWNFNTLVEPHPFAKEDFYSHLPIINEIRKTGIEIL